MHTILQILNLGVTAINLKDIINTLECSRCDYKLLTDTVEMLSKKYGTEYLSIGKSYLCRDIHAVSIGSGKKIFLYVGAHHACEYITASLLLLFLCELCELADKDAYVYGRSISDILKMRRLIIIPMINPDGAELAINGIRSAAPISEMLLKHQSDGDFSHWKANCRGVDLNHNYDDGFSEYKHFEKENGITRGAQMYSGEFPESEPESAALASLVRSFLPCAALSLHTQGEEIFYGANEHYEDPKIKNIAYRLSALCSYRPCRTTGSASYGGFTDWMVRQMGIPCFTLECGKGCNPLPDNDLRYIYATLRKLLFLFPTLF